jgi:DNA-binding transcriptional MerR regulator
MDGEFDAPFSRTDAPAAEADGYAAAAADSLGIAELAREFGITPRALRLYERKGLLSPRRGGTARRYGRAERERLMLVLRAKRLGFTLAEIRQMIDPPRNSADPGALNITRRQCFEQIKLLEERRREIEAAIAELRRIYSSFYVRLAAAAI